MARKWGISKILLAAAVVVLVLAAVGVGIGDLNLIALGLALGFASFIVYGDSVRSHTFHLVSRESHPAHNSSEPDTPIASMDRELVMFLPLKRWLSLAGIQQTR